MNIDLLTKADIQDLKADIINELKRIFNYPVQQKEWLKSIDVMDLLGCSPGTLQNLRVNGTLPFTKMGGTIYYAYRDVLKILNENKRNAA